MTPTNRLRFVKREISTPIAGTLVLQVRMAHILQQWWAPEHLKDLAPDMLKASVGEWRDVTMEAE